jgi:hypothetical protein
MVKLFKTKRGQALLLFKMMSGFILFTSVIILIDPYIQILQDVTTGLNCLDPGITSGVASVCLAIRIGFYAIIGTMLGSVIAYTGSGRE